MNYYNEIKNNLINNEVYKKIKDYSKNKSDLDTYYKVGKLLSEAGKHYGEGIIKNYSIKLVNEVDKKYNESNLKRMRQFYNLIEKGVAMQHQLTWYHYITLIPLKNVLKINYYIDQVLLNNYSYRELRNRIKNKEFERLPEEKNKLINKDEIKIDDLIKNPILIKNSFNYKDISENMLKQLILEDIDNFLMELGNNFCYIRNEYKTKIGISSSYIIKIQ